MKTMHNIEKKQRGFTLIEFMVVIALIGLGLVLVVTQFGQANAANKTSTAVKNLTSLSGGISSFKENRGGFSNVTDTNLLKTNGVPDNMRVTVAGTDQIQNIFGGTVLVAVVTGNDNQYTITYPSVDTTSCVEIATRMVSSFVSVKAGAAGAEVAITGIGDATGAGGTTACGAATTVQMVLTGS